jgi:glycosyltransferase involved in cell wall biosynthesis
MSNLNEEKQNKLKNIYICWQSLSNGKPTGMLKMLLPLFRYSINKYNDNSILYVGYSVGEINEKNIYSIGSLNKWLVIITNKIFTVINNKKLSYGTVRLFQEKIFDYLVVKKIKKYLPVKIITTAYIPKAFEINKKYGGLNVYLPSTPCDVKIFKVLSKEKEKHDFPVTDAYFDKKRVDFISKGVGLSDLICAPNKLVAATFLDTYDKIPIMDLDYSLVISDKWELLSEKKLSKKINFFYCAHTTWLKGINYLLEAWILISNKNISELGKLHIVGNFSPDLKNYLDLKFGSLKDVIYWGALNDPDAIAKECQIGIIPSLLDSNPQTIFECMAAGLPVIATNTSGNSRYINNRINGSVINHSDSNELADEMSWYCSHINSLPLMSAAAISTYKKFGKDINFEELSSEIKKFQKSS